MPPRKNDLLKRAAEDLDDALNDSPVRKKKSKTNLEEKNKVSIPDKVVPPQEATTADPEFIDLYEPEAALRLTKASNSVNFAIDKINFYADLLTVFDNERDDDAFDLADRINGKIAKWGAHREKVQKSMDILLKIAPKKKPGVSLNVETAEGFVSSSDEDDPEGDVEQEGAIKEAKALLSDLGGEDTEMVTKSEVEMTPPSKKKMTRKRSASSKK